MSPGKILILNIMFFILLLPISSEDIINEKEFIIRNVEYQIDGNIRENVLNDYLQIKKGTVIVGQSNLEDYISKKEQLIINQRTIDSGEITVNYVIDGKSVYVDLTINIKVTWNLALLPYPRYNSNKGITVGLRGKDYNFLGGMETLSLRADWVILEDGSNEYPLNIDFAIPFYISDTKLKLNMTGDTTIIDGDFGKAGTTVGLSFSHPLNKSELIGSLTQGWHYDKSETTDKYYFKTSGSIGPLFHTNLNLPLTGMVTYNPGLVSSYAFKPDGTLSEKNRGYDLGLSHSINSGSIDWEGNFRKGSALSLTQQLKYNFTNKRWITTNNIELIIHKKHKWGGLSTRIKGLYETDDSDELGAPIRGIRDSRVTGNSAFYINLDLPIKILPSFLDQWFEYHLSPFVDFALVKSKNSSFSLDEGWYGAGLEGFAFIKSARSIYLRGSFGVDLEAVCQGTLLTENSARDGSSIWELEIMVGHHY